MATEAKENRILDVLFTQLDGIGPVGATWNTDPSVIHGIPGDSVPATPTHQIYLHYNDTAEQPANEEITRHAARATYYVWCVCHDDSTPTAALRGCLNLKRDVLYALFNVGGGEGAYAAVAPAGVWPGPFTPTDRLKKSGSVMGVQMIYADFYLDHQDP